MCPFCSPQTYGDIAATLGAMAEGSVPGDYVITEALVFCEATRSATGRDTRIVLRLGLGLKRALEAVSSAAA